jgi:2-polyprenyl-6-methoxyphenol hydroxylase-like FAD-dependent oxidoreductase
MTNQSDVIIVGAGPTGLALANELALAGIDTRIVDRRLHEPNITRAFAVHARTLELLDARGLAEQVLERGVRVTEVQGVPGATLNLSELPSRYPMLGIVPQSGTEAVLEISAERHGVHIERGAEVVGLEQDSTGVRLRIATGSGERVDSARYVVACDGAHSRVRKLLGVGFTGEQYETHIILADVALADPPAEVLFGRTNRQGLVLVVPFGGGLFRLIIWDRRRDAVPLDEPVTDYEVRDAMRRIAGSDLGLESIRWSTRFLSERRQAERYRVQRVFLAGDAAHVHSPLGAQGMNTGIQDAMNLGWKLASVLRGQAADGLLDSYQAERHPVGAQVLAMTDGFNRLVLGRSPAGARLRALAMRGIIRFGPARRQLLGRLSGIGIRYQHSRGEHPLVGQRAVDLATASGRLYELLRAGRFVLLAGPRCDVSGASESLSGWADRLIVARHGQPRAADLILVRPDGYVGWAERRHTSRSDLSAALTRWLGASTASPAPVR